MADEQAVDEVTGGDALAKKRARIAELRAKVDEAATKSTDAHAETLKAAKGTPAYAKAEAKAETARRKFDEAKAKYRKAGVDLRYAEAKETLRAAHEAILAVEDDALADPETHAQFAGIILKAIEELINVRATANRLTARGSELADRIRTFVRANPTGWVAGVEDPERQYLCYLTPDGRYQVIVEDNPLYALAVDALIELVGLEAATPFLVVDYTAVRDAVKNAQLRAKRARPEHGEAEPRIIALSELRDLRTRTERTAKVKALVRGDERIEEIVAVINPELSGEFVEHLEVLGLDGGTVNALKAAGITRVGEIRCLSGDDLAKIKGIGPARAGKIISAIVRRRKE